MRKRKTKNNVVGQHQEMGRQATDRVTSTVTGPLGVAENYLQLISDDAPTIVAVKGKVNWSSNKMHIQPMARSIAYCFETVCFADTHSNGPRDTHPRQYCRLL